MRSIFLFCFLVFPVFVFASSWGSSDDVCSGEWLYYTVTIPKNFTYMIEPAPCHTSDSFRIISADTTVEIGFEYSILQKSTVFTLQLPTDGEKLISQKKSSKKWKDEYGSPYKIYEEYGTIRGSSNTYDRSYYRKDIVGSNYRESVLFSYKYLTKAAYKNHRNDYLMMKQSFSFHNWE